MKFFFVSLGCDKNLTDSEHIISMLCKAGYDLTDDEYDADVVVVNTCCFIHDAKQESVDTICEMSRLKDNKLKALIVCGCLAQRYKEEILKEIPEVDAVVGTSNWDEMVDIIRDVINEKSNKQQTHTGEVDITKVFCKDLSYLPSNNNERYISTPGHYEYLKIAEGCNKHCTYCIIPKIRGPFRSVPMEILIEEARRLADAGVKELILVAQETTLYGLDLYGKKLLPELLCKLSEIEGLRWIRLLYAYPEEITDELVEVMSTNPKICHYIDIPIQHGSDAVLKRMGRLTNQQELRAVIGKLRKAMPDIAVRTTLITGFPGETQEDFEECYRFVNEMEFDRLGIFTYSREEDTPAYDFADQVDSEVKSFRMNELYELQQAIVFDKNEEMEGLVMNVIIDGYLPKDDVYVARTYRDAPDIDGLVFVYSDRELVTGDMVSVRITDARDYDLEGVMVDELTE